MSFILFFVKEESGVRGNKDRKTIRLYETVGRERCTLSYLSGRTISNTTIGEGRRAQQGKLNGGGSEQEGGGAELVDLNLYTHVHSEFQ
jgi:hypothetical protein